MKERIRTRLDDLQAEFETGEAKLHELKIQEACLRETLLRISGAIQILHELLNSENGEEVEGDVGGVTVAPMADTQSRSSPESDTSVTY